MSDLGQPLIRRRARQGRPASALNVPVARLAGLAIVLLLGAAVVGVLVIDNPNGGRPVAEVPITSAQGAGGVSTANARPLTDSASIITIGPEIAAEDVDTALGQDQTGVPQTGAQEGPPDVFGALPALTETTEFGNLPMTSSAGQTPFAAYSRPSIGAEAAAGRPRIAILVSGLGINVNGTLQAVERLPDTVSLGFAPYGRSLERTVGAARAEGHEIYLEIPLEPFDYPENDPGPDTLLTGQAPRDNIARLYRVMSKFGGYAGVVNNMGARFTASAPDLGPVIEELGTRGLAYLDDGTSNRSVAPQLAKANAVPFARVDLMLDADPSRAAILAQLEALEIRARESGQAMGLATALPVTIETLVTWAAEAESRGILLVPASALMGK